MDDEEMSSIEDDAYDYDDDYYNNAENDAEYDDEPTSSQSENAVFDCLDVSDVEKFLTETVAMVSTKIPVTKAQARVLLHVNGWDIEKVVSLYRKNRADLLQAAQLATKEVVPCKNTPTDTTKYCSVCADENSTKMSSLSCSHQFCDTCWQDHFEARLSEGVASRIECMEPGCGLICTPDFVKPLIDKNSVKHKYERFLFRDYVMSHPHLRFCTGKDCQVVFRSSEDKPKRVTCNRCFTSHCVKCGVEYHAPTSCDTIKLWLVKCADDSETANYISAHTKDCPHCHSCIEKAGGCNHIQCTRCRHHFCWMCFGDWKTHGSEYYECSRYKENPSVAAEANHMKARRALEKYLHYFERYENHANSLKMEEQLRETIMRKIETKVNQHDGTWIDWQYLHSAVSLLTKCRYTLQFTYPFAYYMEPSPRKTLFEYQQAQLEKEVEELAWAVERADGTARGALEAFMHRAEHKRTTLLHDFFF